jgi:hypothetical protein
MVSERWGKMQLYFFTKKELKLSEFKKVMDVYSTEME